MILADTSTATKLGRSLATWPSFGEEEIAAVTAVLTSGRVSFWTGGEGAQFEREYARAVGVEHALAAANGTVTLEMALKVCGIGPGDEVIVTPRSFIASASCVVACGARPIFADVDRDSGNITAETIERVLTPQTRAIIPVHLAGWPCEMDGILDIAQSRNIDVIEDCAQAHGATYRGRPVGSMGRLGSFSFCQDKIITTGGEGGLLTTNDSELWSRLWSLREHGKSYDACFGRQWPGGFRWLHESFGSNARMTEMQAAIGRVALRQLPSWVERRQVNAAILSSCLAKFDAIRTPEAPEHISHARYKYYCYIRPERLRAGWSRDRLMAEISACGVPCFSGSCSEIYLEKAFEQDNLCPTNPLPVARELGETSLMFLVHPTLTDDDMYAMANAISDVVAAATN